MFGRLPRTCVIKSNCNSVLNFCGFDMTHDDDDGGTCFGLMACLLLSLSWLVVVG